MQQRLAEFIRQNQSGIMEEWINFARTRSPASDGMSRLALQDHVADILKFVADDLDSAQTSIEQVDKSHGLSLTNGPMNQSAAEIHSALRLADGFDIDQMVSEYRALRASVVKQWAAQHESLASTDVDDLTRFNEAIDQAVTESVAHYTKTINNSRNLYLGILGHDLRNPIGAASMAARRMEKSGTSDAKQAKVISELVKSTGRAARIVDDLLDLTRSSFGTEIPIIKVSFSVAELCQEIVDEFDGTNDSRPINVTVEGDPMGLWDRARLGQVLSNMIGNATQYNAPLRPITVAIFGTDPDTVSVSVHNFGSAISADRQKSIFLSWTRGQVEETNAHGHLGLGLYVAKLVVEAHGGEITVASDEKHGTTFTVQLPRGHS